MPAPFKWIIFFVSLAYAFQAFAEWSNFDVSLNADAPKMQTRLYVPKGISSEAQKASLIIHLHGCLQTSQDLKKAANWESSAQAGGFMVAFPDVPRGGIYAGCWDYYGRDHTVNNRHNVYLLKLMEELLERHPEVDPKKVYLSGLSSGAGQSVVLACLAPQKVAGIFVVAAPALGSSARDLRSPRSTPEQVAKLCLELSGAGQTAFDSQVAAFIFDPRDFVVHQDHNRVNAKALSRLYQAQEGESFDLSDHAGVDPEGEGRLYFAQNFLRMSVMEHPGLGHNWPAGSGEDEAAFVASQGLNYPAYIAEFLQSASLSFHRQK